MAESSKEVCELKKGCYANDYDDILAYLLRGRGPTIAR
jgi:hypothetical protein